MSKNNIEKHIKSLILEWLDYASLNKCSIESNALKLHDCTLQDYDVVARNIKDITHGILEEVGTDSPLAEVNCLHITADLDLLDLPFTGDKNYRDNICIFILESLGSSLLVPKIGVKEILEFTQQLKAMSSPGNYPLYLAELILKAKDSHKSLLDPTSYRSMII